MLYPLKFMPLFKNKVWGGNKIAQYGFDYSPLSNCGELWALSGLKDNESVVCNGPLAENNLSELLEVYMGDLVGEKNYAHFGNEFPLLIKLIDADDKLSIQVHPDDQLARDRGMDNGKSEMWYVLDADKDASIINGFQQEVTPEEYKKFLALDKVERLLHVEHPEPGDVFYIPAGRVHALGKGLVVAEIQQSSDCTYRIYDYNRPGSDGKPRELHTAEALAAIDFSPLKDGKIHYAYKPNSTVELVKSPHFNTSLIALDKPMRKNFSELDSFVIYFCVDGIAAVKTMDRIEPIHAGECVLVPAVADMVELFSQGPAKLLEIYIDPDQYDGPNYGGELDWVAQFIGSANPDEYLDDDCDDDCDCHHHHHDCDCDDHHHHDCGCDDRHHDCGRHHHHED